MKKCLPLLALVAFAPCAHAQTTTIADWTFETSAPTTAGPFAAEIGTGSALGSHAGASVYSTPAGNGSAHSFSSTLWAPNDYYQFQVSTLNFTSIQISFDQTSSNTGPKDFELEYSTTGTSFSNLESYSVLANANPPNTPWSSTGTPNAAFTTTDDLSATTAVNNDSTLYFRLVDLDTVSANGGTVGTGGTDRVDNVVISGIAAAPEPSSYALGLLALAAFGYLRLRRSPVGR